MTDEIIAQSVAEATIAAPLHSINLAEWVFTLTDGEYQACSAHHIAAAATRTPDGKRMSINVEQIGNLLVQHYVEETAEPDHCRLVSESDSIGPSIDAHAKVRVVWEFWAEAIDDEHTKFINRTEAHVLPGYLEALEKRGIPFEKASQAAEAAMSAHNAEETPLFAKDIERKALVKRWG